jgi:hypothetical protein
MQYHRVRRAFAWLQNLNCLFDVGTLGD